MAYEFKALPPEEASRVVKMAKDRLAFNSASLSDYEKECLEAFIRQYS